MGKNSTNIQPKKAGNNPDNPIRPHSTFKQFSPQGRSERTAETYSCPYVAGYERRENEAGNLFQRAGNKKSSRPKKDLEDCTRFFILARSPAHGGTMVICLGRSSGLWFTLLPVPSHPVTDSGSHGFRPHSQRRDREGVAPSSLYPRVIMCWHSRRLRRNLSSSLLSVSPSPARLVIIAPRLGRQRQPYNDDLPMPDPAQALLKL